MEQADDRLQDLASEMMFIGVLYKYPGLFIKYRNYIGKEDFSTEASKFYIELFTRVYDNSSKDPNAKSISTYLAKRTKSLEKYESYGGFSAIEGFMELCNSNDADMYFENIKKYSLMRAFHEKGFPVLWLLDGKKDEITQKITEFDKLKAKDVLRGVLTKASLIYTKLRNVEEMRDLVGDCKDYVLDKLDRPQMGIPFPYPIMSETFSGMRKNQFMAWGMLSNAGKSRFLMKIISHLAFVQGEKVLLLANEMTYEEMKECMITTILDNPEFQALHGFPQYKPQKEIVNGIYKDRDGKVIPREILPDWGVPVLDKEQFIEKLKAESPDFNLVMNALDWLDKEFRDKLYIIDMGSDYSDGALQEVITNAKNIDNINYVFYDTFKADRDASGDWSRLKNTATMLKELAKELNIFIGANIQLTDDAINVEPLALSSLNIANAKQIKHVMDGLCLFKNIRKNEYKKYCYVMVTRDKNTGKRIESEPMALSPDKTYYVCKIDKNRSGDKPDLLFELDLNYNTWFECGLVFNRRDLDAQFADEVEANTEDIGTSKIQGEPVNKTNDTKNNTQKKAAATPKTAKKATAKTPKKTTKK